MANYINTTLNKNITPRQLFLFFEENFYNHLDKKIIEFRVVDIKSNPKLQALLVKIEYEKKSK